MNRTAEEALIAKPQSNGTQHSALESTRSTLLLYYSATQLHSILPVVAGHCREHTSWGSVADLVQQVCGGTGGQGRV
jgi:hypothetical protein